MSASMWKSTRLKFLSRLPISNGLGVSGEYDNSEWPRFVRITDIANSTKLKQDTFRSLPPEVAGKARLFQNDLLFAAVGSYIGKYTLSLSTVGSAVSFCDFLRFTYHPKSDPPGQFGAVLHLETSPGELTTTKLGKSLSFIP